MDEKLQDLISALSPVMNPIQAEGFLHVAAFTRRKSTESLGIDDWPAIERMVREALKYTTPTDRTDRVCAQLQRAFLYHAKGASG